MFGLGPATRIYLAAGVTDMRKGFEGLYGLVRIDGRYEQINSASSLPWSHGNESSSVSKTASAPYSTAEDAHRGTRCCECSLRGGIRKSKPVQSGVQALLRKTPDARCTSIAGVPVIVDPGIPSGSSAARKLSSENSTKSW